MFAFTEGFNLPHRQILLWEGRIFYYKVPFLPFQPEENPTVGQLSDKDVQCFLCLVVSILNSEREITLHFLEKYKQNTTNKKINSNDLGNNLLKKNVYVIKVLAHRCVQRAGG